MNINQYIAEKDFDEIRLFFRESRKSGLTFIDKAGNSILLNTDSGELMSNSIIGNSGDVNFSFHGINRDINIVEFKSLAAQEEECYFPNNKYSITDTGLIFLNNKNIVGYLNLNIRSKLCRDEKWQNVDLSLSFIELVAKYLEGFEIPIGNGNTSVYKKWEDYRFPTEFYFNPVFKYFETAIFSAIFSINSKLIRLEIKPVNNLIRKHQIDSIEFTIRNIIRSRPIIFKFFMEQYDKWKEDYELPDIKNDEHLFDMVSLSSITIPSNPEGQVRLFFKTWDQEHGQYAYFESTKEIVFE